MCWETHLLFWLLWNLQQLWHLLDTGLSCICQDKASSQPDWDPSILPTGVISAVLSKAWDCCDGPHTSGWWSCQHWMVWCCFLSWGPHSSGLHLLCVTALFWVTWWMCHITLLQLSNCKWFCSVTVSIWSSQGLARKYQKTPAQIALRWGVQRNTIVIPKSDKLERLKQNHDIFNFKLDDEDMKTIKSIDKRLRTNDPTRFWNINLFA
jgi:hypothetical protein